MVKLRIEYDRGGCIAAWACVSIDSENFAMNDNEAKADLVEGTKLKVEGDKWVKEIETDDIDRIIAGANGCPVRVIRVINMDTGEELAPGKAE